MRRTIPIVIDGRLYTTETHDVPIVVGTDAWFAWLEHHDSFLFVIDRAGTIIVRKRGSEPDDQNWEATRAQKGKLNRVLLGPSYVLTLERLQTAALTLAGGHIQVESSDASSAEPAASMLQAPQTAATSGLYSSIVKTKLYPPQGSRDVIPRMRLFELLNAGLDDKVTLVSAPAGFGKTTLLAQWAQTIDRPTAWLSLDERDNEPRLFVQSLAVAMQSAFPGMFHGVASLVEARSFPSAVHVVSLLINDLADVPDDVVLVLDDYHLIHNAEIHTLLDLLIEHQPQQLHLVLSTRSDPPLPLVKWRARGILGDLRPTDLRFTQEETQAFLERILGQTMTRETAVALRELTDGWIAVLRLAALSLRNASDTAALVERLRHSPEHLIGDYLIEEMLNQVAPDEQQLLISVSVLKQFCAELCATLLGGDSTQEQIQTTLDRLERFNLFLVPLDEQHGWYRLYHLFVPLLQERLRAQVSTEEFATLHLRASTWFAERGLIEEAMEHANASGDASAAANLVEAHFLSAFKEQNLVTLERWLRLLPEEQIQGSPGLLFARAWVFQIHGQIADIPRLLKDAERLLSASGSSARRLDDPYYRILHALNALCWSFLQFFAGQAQASLESARSALDWLPPESGDIASLVMQFLAWSSQACGREEDAHIELRQAMEEFSAYPIFTARLLFGQAPIYLAAGKLHQAEQTARHLLRIAQEGDLIVSQMFAHWLLGVVHYEWNELDAAVYHFSVVIANQLQAHFWMAQDSMCGLALAYQAKEAGTQAQETSRALLSVVQEQHNVGQLMTSYAFCGQLALLQDELEEAAQWLEMAGEQAVLGPMMFLQDPPVTRAWLLLAKGDGASVASGQALLGELLKHVESMHSTRKTIQVLALQAWAHDLQGHVTRALDVLERALILALPGGFFRTFANLPPLARLIHELRKRRKARQESDSKLDAYLQELLTAMSSGAAPPVPTEALLRREGLESLTSRELRILRLLGQDLSNKEIARELVLTTGTVKVHTSNVYRKLGVNNRRAAVTMAKALGFLTTSEA